MNATTKPTKSKPRDLTKLTTLELRGSLDPKGYLIVRVFVEGEESPASGIWCDRISVFAGRPPVYILSHKGLTVASVCAQKMVMHREMMSRIPAETIAALGSYVTVQE